MSDIGHNSGGVAGEHLRAFIERVERLEEEKAGLTADIREVYAEAKGNDFDPKVMRQIVRDRKKDRDRLAEERALRDIYENALGMLD